MPELAESAAANESKVELGAESRLVAVTSAWRSEGVAAHQIGNRPRGITQTQARRQSGALRQSPGRLAQSSSTATPTAKGSASAKVKMPTTSRTQATRSQAKVLRSRQTKAASPQAVEAS